MSNLANAHLHSDQDVAPLLLSAHILRTDNEALEAAHALAAVAREQAAKRDRQRQLPWSQIEAFTQSGLGSITIPREFGGPQVSYVTLAEVFLTFLNPFTVGLIVLAFLLNFLFTHKSIINRLKGLTLTTERIAHGEIPVDDEH